MALSTTNLTAKQREQVLNYIAATAASKTMTAQQLLECSADQKQALIKAGIITAKEAETGTTIALTKEKIKEILADETLSVEDKKLILGAFGVTGANLTEASSWEVLGKSIGKATVKMLKWLFLTPAGWATLAITAIVGATAAYIKWGDTLDNTREKLADLKSECYTITSDIESVNSELETTKQRMDELEGKGNLTFTEKEEYDNLVKQNNELQRTIDLLKLEQKEKNKEKNKTFVEAMEKDVNKQDEYSEHTSTGKVSYGYGRSKQDSVAYTSASEMDYINYQFEEIERLKDEKSKASTKADQDRIQGQIDTISEYLRGKNTEFTTDADGIEYIENPTTEDEEKVNKWLDFINDFQDRMAIAMGGDNAKTNAFNRVVDNWQFNDTVQGLQDLGKEGKVTAEMLDDPKYDAFIQKLYELGIIDSVDNLDAVALAFNNVGTEAETAGGNVDKMTVSLSELEDASDKIKTLGSAFKELSDDGYITTKTLKEIQEATGLSGDEWAKYENRLINAKSGSSEFNQILGELTYSILEEKIGIEKLANADSNYIATILRENGVLNANEVATSAIRIAKIKAATSVEALSNATDMSTQKFYDEVDAMKLTAETTTTLKNAYMQAQTAMTTLLQTNALKRLGMMSDELNGIKSYNDALLKVAELEYDGGANYANDIQALLAYGKAQDEINKLLSSIRSSGTPNYSGNLKDSKSSKNDPEYSDPTDAIINRINLRSKEIEKQEEEIQNLIEIAELENDYKKQISLTNDKLDVQRQKVDALKTANNELHQMAENLRNSTPQWNEESWFNSQGQATEAYNTLYNNSSKEEQEKLKNQFEKISKIKKAWVENDEKRLEITKEILQTEEKLVNLDFENSQEWIDERNRLNDWQLFDDNEIAAWERVIKRLKEDYKDCAGAAEKIKEAEQNLFEARQQLIEDVFDAIEKIYDLDINRLNSKSTLLSSHYNLVNAINEEQHNLNKELAEAEIAGAKMNEIERKTLFTKEEHAKLSEKLTSIMNDANNIQSDYLADLETATEDTIEEITNNYERQYELKLKEYEIVKAELNLAKAQQKLENVENEKSVRTWNGTSWVYEANLQDVIDARNEVEDAKYELQRTQTEKIQEIALNKLDEEADRLETEKNKLATTLDEISGKTKLAGEELADALKYISENDLPIFEKIIQEVGRYLESLFEDNSYKDRFSGLDASSYATTISKMKANSEKWRTASKSEQTSLHNENNKLGDSIGADYDDATGTWKDKNGNRLYANGTKNAKSGWGMFDENGIGSEFILTNEGIMHQFDGGEMVFNPEMKERLWKMAQSNMTLKYSLSDFGGLASVDNSVRTLSNDTYYSINGVSIDSEEGASIKGFINYLKKKI